MKKIYDKVLDKYIEIHETVPISKEKEIKLKEPESFKEIFKDEWEEEE